MTKTYWVSVPFAGNYGVSVEAADEDEAKNKALEACPILDATFDEGVAGEIQEWEALEKFNSGNVCYCPHPWEIEAEEEEE